MSDIAAVRDYAKKLYGASPDSVVVTCFVNGYKYALERLSTPPSRMTEGKARELLATKCPALKSPIMSGGYCHIPITSAISAILQASGHAGVTNDDGDVYTAEHLSALLNDRDAFLVEKGLFSEYAARAGNHSELPTSPVDAEPTGVEVEAACDQFFSALNLGDALGIWNKDADTKLKDAMRSALIAARKAKG